MDRSVENWLALHSDSSEREEMGQQQAVSSRNWFPQKDDKE